MLASVSLISMGCYRTFGLVPEADAGLLDSIGDPDQGGDASDPEDSASADSGLEADVDYGIASVSLVTGDTCELATRVEGGALATGGTVVLAVDTASAARDFTVARCEESDVVAILTNVEGGFYSIVCEGGGFLGVANAFGGSACPPYGNTLTTTCDSGLVSSITLHGGDNPILFCRSSDSSRAVVTIGPL